MAIFEKEMEKLEEIHQELGSVEKLFDLPAKVYPDLMKVQNDMKGLKQVYEIYELQKVSACTLIFRHIPHAVVGDRGACVVLQLLETLFLCMK